MHMLLFKGLMNSFWIFVFVIGLAFSGELPAANAQTNDAAGPKKACVNRDGLSFEGVGLWTRLPAVFEHYGKPLCVEPMPSVNKNRVYATYYYKDVKLLIFNSIVWQMTALTDAITTQSGIRLFTEYEAVERMLAIGGSR